MTWVDEELFCSSEGANLVSIHSQEEQNFVQTLIQNFDHTMGHTWIRLSDIHKEGRWDVVLWFHCSLLLLGYTCHGAGGEHRVQNTHLDLVL